MLMQEVGWIRANSSKFCPMLKKAALEWYRPIKYIPCYFQKPFKYLKQRWRKIPVIVQLKENREIGTPVKELSSSIGCRVYRELPLIRSFSTKVTAKKLELLALNDSVKKIWYDREVRAVLDVASPVVNAAQLWEKDFTGSGISVAVLDTGIFDHPDLSGRIKAFKDLVNQDTRPYDDNGHGTHVAGDIASSGSQSDSLYRGPAFRAEVVGVKVLDKMGSGTISTVIEGIQWCIQNQANLNIRVMNMSLGAAATESHSNDPVCQAVEKAWKSGIVVCVAAGNDGPQPRTIGSPGIDPMVITVGALDDGNTVTPEDHRVAGFSSRGPTIDDLVKPDILSPGVNIVSLRSPGSMLDKKNPDSRIGKWYTSLSGTSMATPVCAGVVAQILQSNSSLAPDEVKTMLKASARTLNLDHNIQGAGVIDAQSALSMALQAQEN